MPRYEVIGVSGIGEVRPGDDIARLIVDAAARQGTPLAAGDLLVIGQKIVSKAEGRLVKLADVQPSAIALAMAPGLAKDPRLVEVILSESRRVVRMDKGVLITETHHGWICANAGIDQSNVDADSVALLPEDSDRSARAVRERVRALAAIEVFVIITDTFGRPWRDGLVEFALGVSGFEPLLDLRGTQDLQGRELHHTVVAVADELAAAAGLVMEKGAAVPAVIIRGYQFVPAEGDGKKLIRPADADLFR